MDFFQAQETARKRTGLLVILFLLAVVAIILVIYSVVRIAVGGGPLFDPVLLAQVALAVVVVIALGSLSRTASLRRGGPAVAELLGGRRVAPDTTDLEERKLINVVEEMAIASGTPVPAIYVMDAEDGINAFAAGYSTNDAAVAVTRGALRMLTRDELQGVIAHEFSHILNGDMRLNIHLIGILYGILLLAVIGRGILHFGPRGGRRGGKDNGAGAIMLVAIALFIVGYVGVFFGKLIKAAVSRQREYLADSAAVEFTRNPDGLAGALKKIGAATTGSRIADHHAEELSHLFFANGLKGGLLGFLSTHPPLEDRIRRLDPSWTGSLGEIEGGSAELAGASGLHGGSSPGGGSDVERVIRARTPAGGSIDASDTDRLSGQVAPGSAGIEGIGDAERMVASAGAPTQRHLGYAAALIAALPPELERAAHEPDGAPALVFALLAAADPGGQGEIVRLVGDRASDRFAERVTQLIPSVRSLPPQARLPLIDLLLPALETMSPIEAERFLRTVDAVVRADGTVKLFELTVVHILARRLNGPDATDRGRVQFNSLAGLEDDTVALLSTLAWVGSEWKREAAASAFAAGLRRLPALARNVSLADAGAVSVEQIDQALERFRRASPAVHKQLLEACAECASHDGRIEVTEAEMIRAISEALDCPIPPLLA